MLCDEIENLILDHLENRLSPAQRQEVETHLAGCANCRMLTARLAQLDAALSASVKIPELSSGFALRVQEALQAAPAVLSEAERAERKRQLQAEFEAGLARIGPGWSALGNVLNQITGPGLAVLAGCLVWWITITLANRYGSAIPSLAPGTLALLVASAVFLAVGVAILSPRQRSFFAGVVGDLQRE